MMRSQPWAVKSAVYGGRAIIVETEVTPPKNYNSTYQGLNNFVVKLKTEHGRAFSFGEHKNLATMMTISHSAATDGPNLSAGDGYQPWAAYDPLGRDGSPWGGARQSGAADGGDTSCSMETMSCALPGSEPPPRPFTFSALRPRAREFWSEVGRSLGADGKIILVGCNLGRGHYIDHVANASGRATYGAKAPFSAADVKTVVRVVKGIERGILFEPIRRATPER